MLNHNGKPSNPEEILSRNIINLSIRHPDTNELMWDYKSVKAVLEECRKKLLVILGGDVYKCLEKKVIPAYDNWHTDTEVDSDLEQYSLNSINITEKYIEGYPDPKDGTIFYVIVFK